MIAIIAASSVATQAELLDQSLPDLEIGSVTEDGAHDTRKCHDAVADRSAHSVIRRGDRPERGSERGYHRDPLPANGAGSLISRQRVAPALDIKVTTGHARRTWRIRWQTILAPAGCRIPGYRHHGSLRGAWFCPRIWPLAHPALEKFNAILEART